MADCPPQYQLMPQVVPIYRPQPPLIQPPMPQPPMPQPPMPQPPMPQPPMPQPPMSQPPMPQPPMSKPPMPQPPMSQPPLTQPPMSQPPPPPPPTNAFPMPSGQPIFPMPPHFGYPPIAWSPVHQYPPLPPPPPVTPQQPAHDRIEEDDEYNVQQLVFNNNNNNNNNYSSNKNMNSANNLQIDLEFQSPQRQNRQTFSRIVSNKFDTRHEEFRKYLEEVGILSTFTNILSEMYQDPFRPNDPLGYIRDKLSCSRPETVELKNLRIWCDQYQKKTIRLEKELKHVIERLRKYEPYITDDSLLNENTTENDCNSCVLDVSKLVLESKKENAKHGSRKNYN